MSFGLWPPTAENVLQLRARPLVALASVTLVLASPPVLASPRWDCLEPALKQELERKLRFQDEFAAAIVEQRPAFAEIAELSASASKEGFHIRLSRISWLWENDRDRLADPEAFWSYPWSDEDNRDWRLVDDSHAGSDDLQKKLREQVQRHPDAVAFREFASANRNEDPLLSMAVAFGDDIRSDRDRVRACY